MAWLARLAAAVPRDRAGVATAVRFGGVGLATAGLYFMLYLALAGLAAFPEFLASALAYAAAVAFNYVMHAHFTFRVVPRDRAQIERYVIACAAGALYAAGVSEVATEAFGMSPVGTAAVVTVTLPPFTWLVMRCFVFRPSP